jgi:6-phosphogluconolactonase
LFIIRTGMSAAQHLLYEFLKPTLQQGLNMVNELRHIALIGSVLLLAACGGGNGDGAASLGGSSSSASGGTPPVGKFLYIPNLGSDNITAYSINAATGALTAVPGSPFLTGAGLGSLTKHPSGNFIYTANRGTSASVPTVTGFSVNSSTGALTAVSGSSYWLGNTSLPPLFRPDGPTISPDGKFLYSNIGALGSSYGFAINASTGSLSALAGSPLPTGGASGRFNSLNGLYYAPASAVGDSSVSVFGIDGATGASILLGSAATSASGFVNFDPTNRFLYTLGIGARSIGGFTINPTSGLLTTMTGSPFAWPSTGTSVGQMFFHPSGKFVYVLDTAIISNQSGTSYGPSSISVYSIDQTTGTLSLLGSPVLTGGTNAAGMQVYLDGKFLLVTNVNSASVAIFGINQTTGVLTPVIGSPFATPGTTPGIVVLDPSGKFAYLTNLGTSTITQFTVNAAAGTITVGNTYPTGTTAIYSIIVGQQ